MDDDSTGMESRRIVFAGFADWIDFADSTTDRQRRYGSRHEPISVSQNVHRAAESALMKVHRLRHLTSSCPWTFWGHVRMVGITKSWFDSRVVQSLIGESQENPAPRDAGGGASNR